MISFKENYKIYLVAILFLFLGILRVNSSGLMYLNSTNNNHEVKIDNSENYLFQNKEVNDQINNNTNNKDETIGVLDLDLPGLHFLNINGLFMEGFNDFASLLLEVDDTYLIPG